MRPLTITLPPESFAEVRAGRKRIIATRRNPRKDRYFAAKTPTEAKINGVLYQIARVEGTLEEWQIYLKGESEMEKGERYVVCDRPGFFGGNKSFVHSTHRTEAAAIKAAKKHSYLDERRKRRYPTCVVISTHGKGGVIWGDMFPAIVW